MNNVIRKGVISLMTASLVGCASLDMDDQTLTKVQATAGGALLGGGAAAIACKDKEGAEYATCIAAGATVGGLAGLAAGVWVANRKEQYATFKDASEKEQKLLSDQVEDLKKQNQALKTQIANYQTKVDESKGQASELTAQKTAMEADLKTLTTSKAAIEESLNVAQAQHDDWSKKASSKADSNELKKWKQKVATLQTEKDMFEGQVDDLQAMVASI